MTSKTPLTGAGTTGATQFRATIAQADGAGELARETPPPPIDQNRGSLFPGTGGNPGEEVSATEIGRKILKKNDGELSLFGKIIPRLVAPIKPPLKAETALADLLGGLFANRGLLRDNSIRDYRDDASMRAAVTTDLTSPPNAYGPLTIYRPGLGNTAPGPAQIARHAMFTDKLIIAYANAGKGEEAELRPVTHVDGVLLPPEVQGKIFAIGSPKNLMISWEQASDLLIEQLGKMSKSKYLAGTDLETARATFIAHSQGGADAVKTRERLEDAGLFNVFGTLATENTPFRGSPVSDESMFGLIAEVGQRGLGVQAMGAINALDPDYMKSRIREEHQRLVDVSLVGQTEAGRDGRSDVRDFFKLSNSAIEALKWVGSIFKGSDVRENDGLVTVASQKFGRNQVVLEKSYDHAGIAEDPFVADVLAKHIAAARAAWS